MGRVHADDVIKKFEKDTGIKLTVDTFESNEALEAKLQSTEVGL